MRVAAVLYKKVFSEGHIAPKLKSAYQHAKDVTFTMAPSSRVNPRGNFVVKKLIYQAFFSRVYQQ